MPDRKAKQGASGTAVNMKGAAGALFKYCRKYTAIIVIALLCAIGGAVLTVIGPHYISALTDVIQEGITVAGVHIDMGRIIRIGTLLIGIYVCSMILSYVQHYIMNKVSCRVGYTMRADINKKINVIPLSYFDSHNFGDTLSCVTNDVDMISQSLNQSIGIIVTALATLVGCTVMMFITEWRMAVTAILSCLIGFILMGLIMGRSQKYFNARQRSLADVNGHVEEYFTGQMIVRAYNSEQNSLGIFKKNNEELRKNTFKAEFLAGLMMPLMSFIGNFGYVAVCIVGAIMAFNGTIEFSVVVAFMIYIRLFTSPLGQIGQGFSSLQAALAASERVDRFLTEEELSDESGKTETLESVKGKVVFDHISFGYRPEKTIINDFSLHIAPGQKAAIVGPTGAGKTTLVNLLMRFYELNRGTIYIDDIPASDLKRENVHRIFGMVLQDTWLFHGSVRENLVYGRKDVTDEKLLEICEECGLGHFIRTLPSGLDTVLDDNVTISAGQKQLLTIARAMVEDAPMLILDEATSSVDTRTEAKIQEAMYKLTENRTSFVIAHRLSTIRDADIIIYMKDGDIKETGTHDQLIAQDGLYAELYNSQFVTA